VCLCFPDFLGDGLLLGVEAPDLGDFVEDGKPSLELFVPFRGEGCEFLGDGAITTKEEVTPGRQRLAW